MQILIRDETASGSVTHELTLDVLTETITVRELIRSRVYQEVDDYNRRVRQAKATRDPVFVGLVQPSQQEQDYRSPSGRLAKQREVDWKQQFDTACEAFERNGFFVLVGDRQAETLDEQLIVRHNEPVSFVKLTPLVGG